MRILVADEQPKVRFAIKVLLARQVGCDVVAETENAEELLEKAETDCPDVVLLGWELPGMAAASDLLAALRTVRPDVVVIALSGWPEARKAALAAGADAFVSKADPPERLLEAIYCCGC